MYIINELFKRFLFEGFFCRFGTMRMVLQYLDICERGYDYDFDEADLYGNIDDEEDDDEE